VLSLTYQNVMKFEPTIYPYYYHATYRLAAALISVFLLLFVR